LIQKQNDVVLADAVVFLCSEPTGTRRNLGDAGLGVRVYPAMSPSPAPRPSVSLWDWVQATLLALNLAGTTLALGGYMRETMLWSVAGTMVIVGVKFARGAVAAIGPKWHPAGWWLVPFLIYGAVNAAVVTPVRGLGWWDWLGWVQLVATFWLALDVVALPGPRLLLRGTVVGLGVVLVGLGCYQRWIDPNWIMLGRTQSQYFIARSSGSFGIPNSMAAFLLLLIPVTLAVAWRRETSRAERIGAGIISVVFFGGLILTVSRGPWLALAAALAVWPLVRRGRSWRWRLGMAAGVVAVAVALGALLYATVPGVRVRLDGLVQDRGEKTRPIIWRAAWQLWQDAPVWGTGAGSYNVLFERYRPERFWDEPQWAHNDYLNTLSDYGAAGFGLFFGGVAIVAAGAARRGRKEPGDERGIPRAAFGVGLLAFALALMVDFHLKLPALAMLVAWCGAEGVGKAWSREGVESPERRRFLGRAVALVASIGLFCFAGLRIVPMARAEGWRGEARRQIDRLALRPQPATSELVVLTQAQRDLRRAVELDGQNAQAWSDVSYAAALIARLVPERSAELGAEAVTAARRALAGSAVVPEFWWRLGVGLDLQGRWTEGGEATARSVVLAPNLPQAWFYMAFHFGLRSETRELALTAIATCLRLDPWFRGAEAFREKLNASR
jgi:hypothetical protein